MNCEKLVKVDFTSFNTKHVTNMERMFWNCESLIKIKRKTFHQTKVNLNVRESKLGIIEP